MKPGSVAFLFLGEMFLIPHLLPIAVALAQRASSPRITLFVISSVHEEIVAQVLLRLGLAQVTVRRAWGFRQCPAGSRDAPRLRSKPLVLAMNARAILGHDVAVVAERTSLWIPRLKRGGTAFVYNEHGAGPHANFRAPRNRAARRIMMPGVGMAQCVRESGHQDAPIELVGYIKRDFLRDTIREGRMPRFAEDRPTVIYVPHWLCAKSSWWTAGEAVLEYFARSPDYNLVLAPHMRLPKMDCDYHQRIAPYRDLPNIHIDSGSFRLIDQSYVDGADIYLGDGSSQVIEFAERPRPVVFLNPDRIDWRSDTRFSHWQMGEVIDEVADLGLALARAATLHEGFAPVQARYVERMMGADDRQASERAADVILAVLEEQRARASCGSNDLPAASGSAPPG